jgi:hypothetical protein
MCSIYVTVISQFSLVIHLLSGPLFVVFVHARQCTLTLKLLCVWWHLVAVRDHGQVPIHAMQRSVLHRHDRLELDVVLTRIWLIKIKSNQTRGLT